MKLSIIFVILSSSIFLFQQQKRQNYDDVFANKVAQASTMPVAVHAINGKFETKKKEGVGEKSAEKTQKSIVARAENASDEPQKTATKENAAVNDTNSHYDDENLKPDDASSAERKVNAQTGKVVTSQQKLPNGVGIAKKKEAQQEQTANNLSGDNESKTATTKEVTSGLKDNNPYFTTTIQNNETVSRENYKFSITQKNIHLKVLQTTIFVNDSVVDDFAGKVKLKQGKNDIKIQVTYDAEIAQVTRQYTVYFEENKLIIRTNLQDGMTTTNKYIQFTAISSFNEQTHNVTVKLADEKLVQNESGLFEASLNEGKNIFKIFAQKDGEYAEKTIHIIYKKKQNRVEFATDLQNKQVTSAEFSFYATAELNGEVTPIIAELNGEKLQAKNDFYFDLLKEGKNTIELIAEVDGEKESESYVVYYNEPQETSNQTVPDDKDGPKITTDLKNGMQIRGSIKNINVWATTNDNKRIQANGVAVTVNGKGIGFIWDDKEKTSYKLTLREGENKVVIKAWDEEGRITTKSYKIYAKNIDEGNIIGHATISLEATTLGLGHLIAPTKVEIHEGEKASYVIDQFFRAHNFTYNNTGTLDNNFYLSAIAKHNLTENLKVPADLAAILEKEAEYFNPKQYPANSLSEFTISNGSGWMYSINGDYPNYGFSDAYLLDGDVVRIRFTLFYGADIGGVGATGNGSNDEEGANSNVWKKEW